MKISEEARAARNAYMREYREKMSAEKREKQRENTRRWQRENPERVKMHQQTYWERKAAEMNGEEVAE